MRARAGLLLATTLFAACGNGSGNGSGVDLTITGDATLTPTLSASITQLEITAVEGSLAPMKVFPLSGGFITQRLIVHPAMTSGTITFLVRALDATNTAIAHGSSASVTLDPSSAVMGTVLLTAGAGPVIDFSTLADAVVNPVDGPLSNDDLTGVTPSDMPMSGDLGDMAVALPDLKVTPPPDLASDAHPDLAGAPPPDLMMAPLDLTGLQICTVAPASVVLSAGLSQKFTTSCTTKTTWAVAQGSTAGSIAADGTYTAPFDSMSAYPRTFQIVASSVGGAPASATVIITADPPVVVTASPPSAILSPGQSQTFAANVHFIANQGVNWSVMESGGGTITSAGVYTAPTTVSVNPFHVVAVSQADVTRRVIIPVTVTSKVTVTLSPSEVTLITGQNPPDLVTITATVTGSTHGVKWNGNGTTTVIDDFHATFTPAAAIDLVVNAVAKDDPSATATTRIHGVAPSTNVGSVRGTISYGGKHTGPIFVEVNSGNCGGCGGGTSIPAPGPYAIRGMYYYPQATLLAWMDVSGNGIFNALEDPSVSITNVQISGDVSGADLTLMDPTSTGQPPTPMGGGGLLSSDGVLVIPFNQVWSQSMNSPGVQLADHYRLYLSDSINPGPKNYLHVRTVAAASNNFVIFAPLINDHPYYASVAAIAGGVEGLVGVINNSSIAPTPGQFNRTLTGVVDLTGTVATGPLYAAVQVPAMCDNCGGGGPAWLARVLSPVGMQPVTVVHVPDAPAYVASAFIDQLGDGEITPFEPRSQYSAPFKVSANGSIPPLSIPTAGATVSVRTQHQLSNQGQGTFEGYSVNYSVTAASKLPVTVVLGSSSASYAVIPQDLSLNAGGNGGNGNSGQISFSAYTAPGNNSKVAVNDTFNFFVSYVDGTAETLSGSISELLPVPTLGAVTFPGTDTMFSWAPPSGLPNGLTYSWNFSLWLDTMGNGNPQQIVCQSGNSQLSANVLSLSLNANRCTGVTLTPGTIYNWGISLNASDGNSSSTNGIFKAVNP